MNTRSRTPGDRDRALRAVRRLRLGAALMGTAAVGAFTSFAALNHAATTVTSAATTTSTAQTGSNTASTATPTAGASLSTPTTAPTSAPATAAPVTVSGGSSG
jgi:hypothetical protein